ncbi:MULTISPECIES: C40 family peptidase [unclassified Streptomyces]|uniref:C40 family peptidase n=1 Tax=unclassified Streptomyces TaxID=2593676 RepID=UPI002DDA9180|nr:MULTISPECIES: C40 family peptidase [unclassified Streptomyces]WSA92373.1 C40 family peptidase [Streptomyces sp. NBC_01795]WSB76741.1 C40 family peptidase [Streptomyces sp. NBC_01775]WSS14982.1 C40 family peptidase [Streptomyces sp. NBC_01186]WSS43826.1 C40 family peptidase [Streptomyces sp. NBC_01187]
MGRAGAEGLALLVAVCAVLGVMAPPGLAAPGTPPPGPGPSRRTDAPAPGPGAAGGKSVSTLLGELRSLYQRTEAASEAYNGTEEKLKAQRAEVRREQSGLARARGALAAGRSRAGELARQQYRGDGAGLPPTLQVLLAPDPYRLLERGHLLKRAAGDQAVTMRRLSGGERRHAAAVQREQKALDRRRKLTERKKSQRDQVRERLNEVEKLLSSLNGDQLAQLRRLERDRTDAAQRKLLASGALGDPQGGTRDPSAQGKRALDYALGQLGKPYVWGAEGPGSFDCSGLTSQAWQQARRAIPRTSQEQWRRLPRVALDKLRPGDLVIYFAGATHVGMYAGAGRVVQAPRPGGVVKITPLAANPPIGAVRPDGSRA